jgi:transcriptional regulator with XRE-family HTH domain
VADTVEQAIGQEIRRRREAAGVGQSALAAAARQYGLPWTRATVAAIELGRKQLPLGEMATLSLALSEVLSEEGAGGRSLDLSDLIPTDERRVSAGPGLELPLRIVRSLLLPGEDDRRLDRAQGPREPIKVDVDRRALEAAGDAEQKAAMALRVSPEALVKAAHDQWGRSLTAQRDRLVSIRTDPMLRADPAEEHRPGWPRRLQAIRGHVTRELLGELRPVLKGAGTRKKRRTR